MTTLAEYLQEIEDLKAIAERMWLDQQTTMPAAALTERVRQAGLLQALIQERLTSDRLAELLESAKGDEPWLKVVNDEREKALRLGDSTWKKFLETGAEAFGVWEKARRENDWDTFHPWLAKMVEINHEFASKVGYDEHPMDALLSTYVPGPTKNEIATVLGALRDFLIEARQRRAVTGEALKEMAEPHVLIAIAEDIGHLIGYDFDRGGIAFSPHGYTSTASPNDVRITFRKDVPLFEAVSTAVHEYGHALYGQGIAKELWGTPAQYGAMPYIQESQAKFWENIVGRREDFCMLVGEILEKRVGRGRSAEEWMKTLDSPARVQGLKITEVIAALKLKPGMLVADIGAGTGVFSIPLARAVRPGGKLYAVEVDEKLLAHIVEVGTEQGVTNIDRFVDFIIPSIQS